MKYQLLKSVFFILLNISYHYTLAQVTLTDAFPNFTFNNAVEMVSPSDNTQRVFVVLQSGQIEVFNNQANVSTKQNFLDIGTKVICCGERGLLGLAFHPNYQQNGFFYVYYTRLNVQMQLQSVISRFRVSMNDPNRADAGSELILLTFDQPFDNHNGGTLAFGPDGFLYISSGDGGDGGDPQNNAQNLGNLLGKILRIDVNSVQAGLNYGIPASNPFRTNPSARAEIFAYGLRNPWKMSFHPTTGLLWVADVGQSGFEEIDIVESGRNYGWRIMEGNSCFNPRSNCNQTGLTLPVWQYNQSNGDRSITGGFFFLNNSASSLFQKYIYGDYISGRIWALTYNNNQATNAFLIDAPGRISTFGIDSFGNIYAVVYGSRGKIYKISDSQVTSLESRNEWIKEVLSFPNPAGDETSLEFYLSRPSEVSVELYDLEGNQKRQILKSKKMSEGKHNLKIIRQDLPSGIYIAQITTRGLAKTVKILFH